MSRVYTVSAYDFSDSSKVRRKDLISLIKFTGQLQKSFENMFAFIWKFTRRIGVRFDQREKKLPGWLVLQWTKVSVVIVLTLKKVFHFPPPTSAIVCSSLRSVCVSSRSSDRNRTHCRWSGYRHSAQLWGFRLEKGNGVQRAVDILDLRAIWKLPISCKTTTILCVRFFVFLVLQNFKISKNVDKILNLSQLGKSSKCSPLFQPFLVTVSISIGNDQIEMKTESGQKKVCDILEWFFHHYFYPFVRLKRDKTMCGR